MDILRHYLVVVRKKHQCFACLREYEPKTKLWLAVITEGGEIYNSYSCPTCHELINKHSTLFSDDNYFDENCVNEVLRYPEYKSSTPEELLKVLNKSN